MYDCYGRFNYLNAKLTHLCIPNINLKSLFISDLAYSDYISFKKILGSNLIY